MNIVVLGRGNVGGGLARLWTNAGHAVTALGRDGGDASHADVLVVAVPGGAIADALSNVTGAHGKPTLDATNSLTGPKEGFPSLAAEVKSIVGGPTIKAFNTNFAVLYDQIGAQRVRPHSVFASDPDARGLAEQLIGDAGFDPLYSGCRECRHARGPDPLHNDARPRRGRSVLLSLRHLRPLTPSRLGSGEAGGEVRQRQTA